VESVEYDFGPSTANFTGGEDLNDEKTGFNWLGNQIADDGGWVVFLIASKGLPEITRLSTRFVGLTVPGNKLIPPDPDGLR